ncbi:MAG: redoxin domain-containing protein [Fimbriimonadaceae bacterium]|nr:MAG: redoxin domain-containing protein [Fimbriimonadaceae bacterium]
MKVQITIAAISAIMIASVVVAQRAPAAVAIGKPAPNFSAPAASGKTISLNDYKGKWVVMEWNNKDCPIVVRHYNSGSMQATQKWATEKGVVWLSVCSSAPGKQGHVDADGANEMLKAKGATVSQYLLDPQGEIGRMYGARTTPHMFVINPAGETVYMGAIDDSPNASAANTSKARNYVREALTLGMAGKPIEVATSQPYGCGVKY